MMKFQEENKQEQETELLLMKFNVIKDNDINLYENLLSIYVQFSILLNIFTINKLQNKIVN